MRILLIAIWTHSLFFFFSAAALWPLWMWWPFQVLILIQQSVYSYIHTVLRDFCPSVGFTYIVRWQSPLKNKDICFLIFREYLFEGDESRSLKERKIASSWLMVRVRNWYGPPTAQHDLLLYRYILISFHEDHILSVFSSYLNLPFLPLGFVIR